jgi:hypothetical protein
MHGGGPKRLVLLEAKAALSKYGPSHRGNVRMWRMPLYYLGCDDEVRRASVHSAPSASIALTFFGEARRSADRFIAVDFLTGAASGGRPSSLLAQAILKYRNALIDLCIRHQTSVAAFRTLTTRYSKELYTPRLVVMVEDGRGRRSVDEYAGHPGARIRVLDPLDASAGSRT